MPPMTTQMGFLCMYFKCLFYVGSQHRTEWCRKGLFSGSIFSSYQKHGQGLQSHSAAHISLCDIHPLQDNEKEAATVMVRDEGHTLEPEYHLYQGHKDNTGFFTL